MRETNGIHLATVGLIKRRKCLTIAGLRAMNKLTFCFGSVAMIDVIYSFKI